MKRIKHIICLLAVALAGSGSLNAQGLGFIWAASEWNWLRATPSTS